MEPMTAQKLGEPLVQPRLRSASERTCSSLLRQLGMAGHPPGLPVLFFTEMWERFSFFGLTSLLVLYLNDGVLEAHRLQKVLGGPLLVRAFGQPRTTREIEAVSLYIFGGYTGAAYMLPLAGGALADRVFGPRLTMLAGGSLMAVGHCCMTVEHTFLLGLLLAAIGNGAFKPNVSAQLGMLYEAPSGLTKLRDRGFAIFYAGINIGAALAPLVCGYLQQAYGYSAAFGAAGVGMVGGLTVYVLGMHLTVARASAPLSVSPPPPSSQPPLPSARGRCCTPEEQLGARRSLAVLALCLLTMPFWMAYAQSGSTMQLYFDARTDRRIGSFVVPSPWLQALNPILCVGLLSPLQRLWAWQAARRAEPSSSTKMAIGAALLAVGFALLAAGSHVLHVDDGADAPLLLVVVAMATLKHKER
jgi:POT family proton-dependent oligopeptide transporter